MLKSYMVLQLRLSLFYSQSLAKFNANTTGSAYTANRETKDMKPITKYECVDNLGDLDVYNVIPQRFNLTSKGTLRNPRSNRALTKTWQR